MAFTYDNTTSRGRVRLLISDTDSNNPLFDDSEIDAFLSLGANDVYDAGAIAFETVARSRAKLLKAMQMAPFRSEQHAIKDMLEAAESLRQAKMKLGGIQVGAIETTDEHFESHRPEWIGQTWLDEQL